MSIVHGIENEGILGEEMRKLCFELKFYDFYDPYQDHADKVSITLYIKKKTKKGYIFTTHSHCISVLLLLTLIGLEQHTFIILQFWRPEVQNQPGWSLLKAPEEGPLPCLFWLLEVAAFLGSELSSIFKVSSKASLNISLNPTLCFCHHLSFSDLFRDPCDDIEPMQIIQDRLPITMSLISPHLLCKVT